MSLKIKLFVTSTEIRRFQIYRTCKFEEFVKRLTEFGVSQQQVSKFKYLDEDKDWITFGTDAEWKDALDSHVSSDPLQVMIVYQESLKSDSTSSKTTSGNQSSSSQFTEKQEQKIPQESNNNNNNNNGSFGPNPFGGIDLNQLVQQFAPLLGQFGVSLRPEDISKLIQPENLNNILQHLSSNFQQEQQQLPPFLAQWLHQLHRAGRRHHWHHKNREDNDNNCSHDNRSRPSCHFRVVCDGCEQCPIIGDRWHCNDCKDFDLCSSCHQSKPHDKSHSFTKIEIPQRHCHRGNNRNWCRSSNDKSNSNLDSNGCGGTCGSSASQQQPMWCNNPFLNLMNQYLNKSPPKQEAGPSTNSSSSTDQQQQSSNADNKDINMDEIICDDKQPLASSSSSSSVFSESSNMAVEEQVPIKTTVPVQPPQQQEVDYSQQLTDLQSMGFPDRTLNLYLLRKFQGNLQRVVGELLSSQ